MLDKYKSTFNQDFKLEIQFSKTNCKNIKNRCCIEISPAVDEIRS